MRIEGFLNRLEAVKPNGPDRWQARCPAHDDRTPSLSIGLGDDERILVTCFAGCTTDEVVGALGLSLVHLFSERENGDRQMKREIVATYPYTDENGELLFEVVRFEPKDFRQRKPDGAGGWNWKLGDSRRVLYRLPKIIEAVKAGKPVAVVEGEKDVERLEAEGKIATCNPQGAGKWKPDYSESLREAKVAVIADRDEPGRKHAAEVAASLVGIAAEVKVFEPAEGKDVSDHLAAGKSLRELVPVDLTEPRPEQDGPPVGVRLTSFATLTPEKIDWLWDERVPLGMLTLLVGDPGLGKSLLTVNLAAKVSRAGGNVVISGAEDHATATVLPRLEAAEAEIARVHRGDFVDAEGLPRTLELPDDVDDLAAKVEQTNARLVVVDPLTAHLPEGVNSWRDQSVRRALAPLHRLAEANGCAVIVVAHLNKATGSDPLYRTGGSIAIPAAVRSALLLARDPEDPEGDRGSRRVLAHHKSNVGPLAESLSYEVEIVGEAARLRGLGTSSVGARDLLDAPSEDERTERDEAVDLLREELAVGPRPVKEVQAVAREAGISTRTLERAKSALGIRARKEGFGKGWNWALPEDRHDEDRHSRISEVAAFGETASGSGIEDRQPHEDRHASDMAAFDAEGEAERIAQEVAQKLGGTA
jgi:hypothetical protein